MRQNETTETHKRRNRLALVLGLALVVLAGGSLVGAGSAAVFTDTASSTGNAFTTGTLDLKLSDSDETDADAVTASLTLSGMVPADSITRPLTIKNANGSNGNAVAARYAVSSSVAAGSSPLAQRLDLLVGKRGTAGTCDSTATFGSGEATAAEWVLIYQGDLARSTSLGLIGSSTAGQDAAGAGQISGDRALAGNGGTEYLCFRVTFRDSTDNDGSAPATGEGSSTAHSYVQDDSTSADDNTYKDLTATVSFTFAAEQTSTGTAN